VERQLLAVVKPNIASVQFVKPAALTAQLQPLFAIVAHASNAHPIVIAQRPDKSVNYQLILVAQPLHAQMQIAVKLPIYQNVQLIRCAFFVPWMLTAHILLA
jgi:hypothetical protein